MKRYDPKSPQSFWCNECDMKLVDSEDKSTGHFYVQFGYAYDKDVREYEGDWVGVMFAICNECSEKMNK